MSEYNSCSICSDVSSIENPNSQYLISPPTNHTITWCISSNLFTENIFYSSPNQYFIDLSTNPINTNTILHQNFYFDSIEKTFDFSLINPTTYGSERGENAKIGNYEINYLSSLYTTDSSGIIDGNHEPTNSTTSWFFTDSSFSLSLHLQADCSNIISCVPIPKTIQIEKPHNDAACDNIQIKMNNISDISESFFNIYGLTGASPDIVSATLNVSSLFSTLTNNRIEVNKVNPVIDICNVVFSSAIDEIISHFDLSQINITNTETLQSGVEELISGGYLQGLQGNNNINFTLNTNIFYVEKEIDISFTPILSFVI